MPRLHAPAALKLDIYFAGISPGETACPQKNTIVAGLCLGWRIGRWTRERGRRGKEKKKRKVKRRVSVTCIMSQMSRLIAVPYFKSWRIVIVVLKIHGMERISKQVFRIFDFDGFCIPETIRIRFN